MPTNHVPSVCLLESLPFNNLVPGLIMSLLRLRATTLNLTRCLRVRRLHTTQWRREREKFDPTQVERAEDEVDVCIVGAGPAGLSAAIRLKQLEQEKGRELRVVVLEKGSEVGE